MGSDTRSAQVVFLVGFMGAGKTSVGRALAERLNWTFEDLDERVVAREGRSIVEIFRVSGEPAFRRAEHAALLAALEECRGGIARIIALGGGAFAQSKNAKLLRSAGVPTVFLDAPVEELWRRCFQQATQEGVERPLLKSAKQFQSLYRDRKRAYQKASLRIDTSGQSVSQIAAAIAQTLSLAKVASRTEQGEIE